MEWKYGDITGNVTAAAMEVYRELRPGFPEHVYQRALVLEFPLHDVAAVGEYNMPIFYKGTHIASRRVDFLIADFIPTEIKAVSNLDDGHLSQALNYLEAFNVEIGLLLNFGASNLQFKRIFNRKYRPSPPTPNSTANQE